MAKTSLQLWHELQNANVSNSTGYMNEFVSSENPLRTGNHVFKEIADIEPNYNKIQRMSGDSGGGEVINLENFRENLLSGREVRMDDFINNRPRFEKHRDRLMAYARRKAGF